MMKNLLKKFEKEQLRLAKKVILKDTIKKIHLIASCDQAFQGDTVFSVILVFDYKSLTILEMKQAQVKAKIPYIPGYLAFREMPAIINAYKKLKLKPDILLVDANGILHPRKIGMASHLGVLLDIPTIGVAKRLLCGKVVNNKVLIDNKQRGMRLITTKGSKPIYVSPGHKISLKKSIAIVNYLVRDHRLPKPLYLAHLFVNELAKINK